MLKLQRKIRYYINKQKQGKIFFSYFYKYYNMKKIRSPTEQSNFTQYHQGRCLHQTKLPYDDQSSFSSLDSQIVNDDHHIKYPQKFNYLAGPKKHSVDSNYQLKMHNTIINKRKKASKPLTLFQQQNKLLYQQKSINQKRIQQLTIQNDAYKRQLQLLKQTNIQIQQQLKLSNDQVNKLRYEISNRNNRSQYMMQQQKTADRQLIQTLKQYEHIIEQVQLQKKANQNKLLNERARVVELQRQVNSLRQKISSFDRQLYQINLKEDELRVSYGEAQKKYIRRISQLQKNQNGSNNERWKQNFIKVFMDMINKVGRRQGFSLKQEYSDKKKTKLGWKFLKQLVFKNHIEQAQQNN